MVLQFALVHTNTEYFTLSECTLLSSNAHSEMITPFSFSVVSTRIHCPVIRDRTKYHVNHTNPTALSVLYNNVIKREKGKQEWQDFEKSFDLCA